MVTTSRLILSRRRIWLSRMRIWLSWRRRKRKHKIQKPLVEKLARVEQGGAAVEACRQGTLPICQNHQ
jgi:hypothetical protein